MASIASISVKRAWLWRARMFARHRLACVGLVGIISITLLSLLGPIMLDASLQRVNLDQMFSAPSVTYPLGTDQLGRDLLWRIMAGGQTSLWVGLVATVLATTIGCGYGVVSAMHAGPTDRFMMQLLDAILAVPVLLLVIVVQAVGDSSLLKVILTIGFASWMGTARMVRTECLRLLQSTFIQAAIVAGASSWRIVFFHLLPNTLGPLTVVVTIGIGQAVLLEATLSFLNLGVPSALPSWGNLMGNGMSAVLGGAWWTIVFPGLMIVTTVLCINLVGDGLRDMISPRQRDGC
jgi:peptide/nickel transport system permease protein